MTQVSIIIPTYNEEKFLPTLLKSIKNQTYKNFEIIVADAGSTDKTVELAKFWGAKTVKGGMPSTGRNAGAKAANGDYFLFLDSDTILPETFLENALLQFENEYLEIAIPHYHPISSLKIDQTYFQFQRSFMDAAGNLYPFTHGAAILVTKRLHYRIGGFNENMKIGEDNDYGNRAKNLAKMGILNNTHIMLSTRRLDKEGRLELVTKYLRHGLSIPLKHLGISLDVEYEFGNFGKAKSLPKLEQTLEGLLEIFEKGKKLSPKLPSKKSQKQT